MPEETPGAAVDTGAGASTVEQILAARGIDPSKLGDILDGYSKDVPELRKAAKIAAEERAELEKLRKAREESEAATLSDIDKARKAQADAEKRSAELEANLKQRDRKLLLEQHLAEVTRVLPESVAGLCADYVRATIPSKDWETDEELKPLMTEQLDRWKTLAPAEGGGASIPFGAPGAPGQGGQPGSVTVPSATPDGMAVPFLQRFRNAGKK